MTGIERFPGATLSPEVLLHQVLEQRPKGVVVLTINEQEQVTVHWSTMDLMMVIFAKEMFNLAIGEYLRDPDLHPEPEESPPSEE